MRDFVLNSRTGGRMDPNAVLRRVRETGWGKNRERGGVWSMERREQGRYCRIHGMNNIKMLRDVSGRKRE